MSDNPREALLPTPVDADRGQTKTSYSSSARRRGRVILRADGQRAASGISSHYASGFPPELAGVVSRKRYDLDISEINHALADYWPCPTCYIGGFLCCPCTLGLSLLCPNICLSNAEKYVRHLMRDVINHKSENAVRNLEYTLHRGCCGGYIQIEFDTLEDQNSDSIVVANNAV